jgi:hypothetical protein
MLQLYTPYSPSMGGNNMRARFGNYDTGGWTGWHTIAGLELSQLWTAPQQFRGNRGSGSYGINNSDYTLQAFSDDGGGAGMSFHRGGAYATNMTLDPDLCIRIGGWSAGTAGQFSFNVSNGDFWARQNVIAYSDERLKENWQELGNDFVERWATVKYGIYDRKDTGERQAGLSAQSVRKVMPDVITRDDKGMLGLMYGNAAAVATVALAQRCVELEELLRGALARIDALELKQGI